MVVDDIVVCGAEPLFMTDYIATGRVVPERIAAIVSGIAAACEQARVALVGGETAEHPGLLEPDEYDVAGAATGVVEYADVLGPDRVAPGDVVLALGSSGLHSNGYSLVRKVSWRRRLGARPARRGVRADPRGGAAHPDPGLLRGPARPHPDRRHRRPRPVARHRWRTGGQPRPRPAAGRPRTPRPLHWTPPAVFSTVGTLGRVPRADLERTLNMGVGFVAMLPADQVDAATRELSSRGIPAGSSARSRRWRARPSSPGSRSSTEPRASTAAPCRSWVTTPPE